MYIFWHPHLILSADKIDKYIQIFGSEITAAALDNEETILFGLFPGSDKTRIDNGSGAKVWLEINHVNNLDPAWQNLINMEIEKTVGKNADQILFDIDLYRQLAGENRVLITNPGINMNIRIKIPDKMINNQPYTIRDYKILRLHKDSATNQATVDILDSVFNSSTNELTFKSDKFSIYVLTYKDTYYSPSYPVTGIKVSPDTLTLTKKDETAQLTAEVTPSYADNKRVTWQSSDEKVATVDENGKVTAVGNGTASRESEQIIADLIKEINAPVRYVITNEAGASVYSASKQATEEFPNFDVGQRSAVSIARRVQDPLAELVKIDPKAIGVGQYQHDMNQKKLDEMLHGTVEDCVNQVGVDLNTASAALLEYVSGITKTIAKNIVTYREENGQFTNRKQLLKVAKLGPKAYEQCAGFLRIRGGDEPLDATAVHPESYEAARAVLASCELKPQDILEGKAAGIAKKLQTAKLAKQLGIGELTLTDIVKELEKPSRDPRDEMPKPILRSDVLSMEDLKPDMELKGTVRNVVDFGAFVDIGVHEDGLVHLSQLCNRYVKHPSEVVSVGDIVNVRVLSVDLKKKRIALTMKTK